MKSVNRETRPGRQPSGRIILNLPPELAEQVRDLARRERRPISTQVQMLVEQAMGYTAVVAA